ncbi:MAG: Yip1 family protein [bacterium]|nr:Yip1 family protein [bacterium]
MEAKKEMGFFEKLAGIFISPRETFEALDRKPTWLIPFLIVVAVVLVMTMLTRDISMQDMLARFEASDMPQEQIDRIVEQSQGPGRYFQMIGVPVFMIAVWCLFAGILLFTGNTLLGGKSTFKKMLSMVSWSSLIGVVSAAVHTALIVTKGTTQGVTTSLALLLADPEPGAKPSFLFRLLSKFDVFTIWEMVLWAIGTSVLYRFSMKKSAGMVAALWVLWVIISVSLGGLFQFGM